MHSPKLISFGPSCPRRRRRRHAQILSTTKTRAPCRPSLNPTSTVPDVRRYSQPMSCDTDSDVSPSHHVPQQPFGADRTVRRSPTVRCSTTTADIRPVGRARGLLDDEHQRPASSCPFCPSQRPHFPLKIVIVDALVPVSTTAANIPAAQTCQ